MKTYTGTAVVKIAETAADHDLIGCEVKVTIISDDESKATTLRLYGGNGGAYGIESEIESELVVQVV